MALAFLGSPPFSFILTIKLTGILAGINFFMVILFFPETRYVRKLVAPGIASETSSQEGDSKPAVQVDIEPANATPTSSIPKKTFLQELNPWSGFNQETNLIRLFLRPFLLVVYPATIYAILTFAAILGWYLCVISTYGSVFQRPPYSMSPGVSSLINIAGTIGVFAGSYCGGALTDKFAEWYARKNNGVFEPEARLVALILPTFLIPAGLLMYVPP